MLFSTDDEMMAVGVELDCGRREWKKGVEVGSGSWEWKKELFFFFILKTIVSFQSGLRIVLSFSFVLIQTEASAKFSELL
jgi:hypothetical protein